MLVNQIAVFLENRKGRLDDFARVLAEEKIDLVTMSIADTKDFGILRAITKDNARAVVALKNAGFTVTTTNLLGITVDDEPGGLSKVLCLLDDGNVDIEYLYSYARTEKGKAIILLKVSDVAFAQKVIEDNGISMLENGII